MLGAEDSHQGDVAVGGGDLAGETMAGQGDSIPGQPRGDLQVAGHSGQRVQQPPHKGE